ncbi:L-seryl-tRNA(Ser) seleniumtransferase [Kineosphaera limosa]|uniref:L-seryl-tRNA(Sec) selenium transferase n=1 Tax=Kineosphaera limosa NBRC 100340 TaxID=1184609 RepID=K6X9Z4_9MICO|nr:L-seryl-tRNA(Sec) selenium transferase [Kineosphaera limosa]NYD99700.1 L-seryl-tRNA(Ser) seleniumtransferase [Kineosphaera limosa]GAB95654.1 L-seryl-tRNA(Sec) selenium transferase [Kineosphaera limosa NBRC 100340]
MSPADPRRNDRRPEDPRRDDPRRAIPRTDALLAAPEFTAAAAQWGTAAVKTAIRAAQESARRGQLEPDSVGPSALAQLRARERHATTLRPVLNATGVILHTNLGRAPLSPSAREALAVASGYCDVEFDLADGTRARRGRGTLQALTAHLPEGTGALVVNNGAAALALVVAALAVAPGRPEVVVSRGEFVEIGDGFRIPELLAATGAALREVGTTNRTHLADYLDGVGPQTGAVLKVHPSNFRITGFTREVDIAELAGPCRERGLPLVVDIGGGLLTADPLLPDEPDATSVLRAGASLVTASCDKLLGGPQGGLVLGDPALVARVRRHPLARAMRVDKTTLAALEATLRLGAAPTHVALHTPSTELRTRAARLADLLPATLAAQVVRSDGAVGGGCAPGVCLPGWAVAIPERLAPPLRVGDPSDPRIPCVVGRLEGGHLLLDVRCLTDDDLTGVAAAVAVAAFATHAGAAGDPAAGDPGETTVGADGLG